MWKILLTLLLFLAVGSLSACDVSEMSSLPELSRPYAGEYRCESLRLGGADLTETCEIVLALDYDGGFELRYKLREGGEGSFCGTYAADLERGEITLTARRGGRSLSRTYPFDHGSIRMDGNFLGRQFWADLRLT